MSKLSAIWTNLPLSCEVSVAILNISILVDEKVHPKAYFSCIQISHVFNQFLIFDAKSWLEYVFQKHIKKEPL